MADTPLDPSALPNTTLPKGKNSEKNKKKRERAKNKLKEALAGTQSGVVDDRSVIGQAIAPDVDFSSPIDRQLIDADTGRHTLPIVGEIYSIHPLGVDGSEFNNVVRRKLNDVRKLPSYSGFNVDDAGNIPTEFFELYFGSIANLIAFMTILKSLNVLIDMLRNGDFKHNRLLESILDDFFYDLNISKARFRTAFNDLNRAISKFYMPPEVIKAIEVKFTPISIPTDGDTIIVLNCVNMAVPNAYKSIEKGKIKDPFITVPFSTKLNGKYGFTNLVQLIECYTDDLNSGSDVGGEFYVFHNILKQAQPDWAIELSENIEGFRPPTSAESLMRLNRWSAIPEVPVVKSITYTHFIPGNKTPKESILNIVTYGDKLNTSPKFITTKNRVNINDRPVKNGDFQLIDRDYRNVPGIWIDASHKGISSRDVLELEMPFNKDNDNSFSICEPGIFIHSNCKHGFCPIFMANPSICDDLDNCINIIHKDKSNITSVIDRFMAIDELTVVGYIDEKDIFNENSVKSNTVDEVDDEDDDNVIARKPKTVTNTNSTSVPDSGNSKRTTIIGTWIPHTVYLSSHNINRREFSYTQLRPHIIAEASKIWNTDKSTDYFALKVANQLDSQYKIIPVNQAIIT